MSDGESELSNSACQSGLTKEPVGGEATYSLSDQPTNQPTQPTYPTGYKSADMYVSVRVTIDHKRESDLYECIDDLSYCYWPHTGSKGDNPHFHVLLPIPDSEDPRKFIEKIRKRIKDKLCISGAGKVMLKSMTNSITEGVTYCAKEHTEATYSKLHGDWWEQLVQNAPKWVEKGQQPIQQYLKGTAPRKPINEDHCYQITYQNLLKCSLKYHKRHGTPPDLASTLEHMHKNNWFLSPSVIRGGIYSIYFDEFEARAKGDTVMKKSRFEFMRVVPNYTRGL